MSVADQAMHLYTHMLGRDNSDSALTLAITSIALGKPGSVTEDSPRQDVSFHEMHNQFDAWFYKFLDPLRTAEHSFGVRTLNTSEYSAH